ncbi:hypothetical protein [Microbacterium sp. Kw_RZR3]|jgi:hypothetical protein|uniref:hypothetical protein n=1 Tax=unclassified Microbacterium TaxID=2609290 RepID=UPI0023D9B1B1|nr:hypothetical protein [Microbacterium sp. Kw_RZR3]MDF2044652.1 hypothetical protein [Microbacterium sp. Kw_RZR3]MDF2919762.1 transcriptional regulator [Microbacterium sp.]
MRDKLLVTALLGLSFVVGVLVSLTVPFIALSAVGADAPSFTPYLAATLVALVAIGHGYVAFRVYRARLA